MTEDLSPFDRMRREIGELEEQSAVDRPPTPTARNSPDLHRSRPHAVLWLAAAVAIVVLGFVLTQASTLPRTSDKTAPGQNEFSERPVQPRTVNFTPVATEGTYVNYAVTSIATDGTSATLSLHITWKYEDWLTNDTQTIAQSRITVNDTSVEFGVYDVWLYPTSYEITASDSFSLTGNITFPVLVPGEYELHFGNGTRTVLLGSVSQPYIGAQSGCAAGNNENYEFSSLGSGDSVIILGSSGTSVSFLAVGDYPAERLYNIELWGDSNGPMSAREVIIDAEMSTSTYDTGVSGAISVDFGYLVRLRSGTLTFDSPIPQESRLAVDGCTVSYPIPL